MELNEKIAARRKELLEEAAKNELEIKTQSNRNRMSASQTNMDAAVGVSKISERGNQKFNGTQSLIDRHAARKANALQNETALKRTASDRFQTWDHIRFWGILCLGIYRFSEGSFLHGIILFVAAFVFLAYKISQKKLPSK
ncbi:MAG: hypothetical protein WC710_09255 [Gallionella sp.]|jgi:uncharacterized membrane protein YjjP (DUF1212 family)